MHSCTHICAHTHTHTHTQLEASHHGAEPPVLVGSFGGHPLYRYLGYYSQIGLLRLHCQLGDHYIALQSVAHVLLSKKVLQVFLFFICHLFYSVCVCVCVFVCLFNLTKALTTTRVPASQITLYYYVGFCYLMLRRYKVCVIRTLCPP